VIPTLPFSPLDILFSGSVQVLTSDHSGSRSSLWCRAPAPIAPRRMKGRFLETMCWMTIVTLSHPLRRARGGRVVGVGAWRQRSVLWGGSVRFVITGVFFFLASLLPLGYQSRSSAAHPSVDAATPTISRGELHNLPVCFVSVSFHILNAPPNTFPYSHSFRPRLAHDFRGRSVPLTFVCSSSSQVFSVSGSAKRLM